VSDDDGSFGYPPDESEIDGIAGHDAGTHHLDFVRDHELGQERDQKRALRNDGTERIRRLLLDAGMEPSVIAGHSGEVYDVRGGDFIPQTPCSERSTTLSLESVYVFVVHLLCCLDGCCCCQWTPPVTLIYFLSVVKA